MKLQPRLIRIGTKKSTQLSKIENGCLSDISSTLEQRRGSAGVEMMNVVRGESSPGRSLLDVLGSVRKSKLVRRRLENDSYKPPGTQEG